MEALLINIREDNNIEGIQIDQNNCIKLSCYADDLTCFIKDVNSAHKIFQILNDFYLCSSLKVNIEKTEAMWLGSKRGCKEKPLDVVWTDKVKVLGIVFSYDEKLAQDKNFEDNITSLKQTLSLWKNRDLTVIGKILIVKVFGLSKFNYVSSMISTPVAIQKRVNTLIHQFIWNGPDRVKRSEMSANYDEGGLKMIDIFTKIKAQQLMWLKRFFSGNQVGWKLILSYYLKNTGGLKFLLQCNFNIQKLACHIPQFYVNILNTWSEITYCKPDTVEKIKNQIIWNNDQILVNNKSVYYKEFSEAGIMKIGDLFDVSGKIKSFNTLRIKQRSNIDFLRWYGIVQAIPGKWRCNTIAQANVNISMIDQDVIIGCTLENRFVPLDKVKSVSFYKHLTKAKNTIPKCLDTLKNIYNIDMQSYKDLFMLPWKTTIDSRLRWMQFRINHFILPTNKWLHKIGLIDSPICKRCNTHIETMVHMIVECPKVNEFWLEFVEGSNMFNNLSRNDKLFGILEMKSDNWQMKNQLLLIARRYICMSKYRESPLLFGVFKLILKDTARLEEVLAGQKDKLEFHYQKWAIIDI